MRKSTSLTLIGVGCLGQMCVLPGTPLPDDRQIVAQDGIPEGVYVGTATNTTTMSFLSDTGEPDEDVFTHSYTLTKTFGSTGVPNTVHGFPLSVGAIKELDLGAAYGTAVVYSIAVDTGRVVVICNVTMYLETPGMAPVELVGMSQEVYELVSSVDVSWWGDISVSGFAEDGVLLVQQEHTAILSR